MADDRTSTFPLATGRNNPRDYIVGRGVLYFGVHDANGRPSKGYLDLGNCTELKVNMESTELDHMSSRLGVKYVDRQVLLSQKMTISFKLDEINFDNLALFLSGTTAGQGGHVQTLIASPTDNIAPFSAVLNGGVWYDLYQTADPSSLTKPFEDRAYDLGTVTVTGGVSPTAGTDYIIDYKMGRIFIVEGGVLDGADTGTVAITAGTAATLYEVRALLQAPLRGSLKFIQVNPSNADMLREYEFHSVQLKANGELDLIGDTWQELGFTGVAEKNTAQSSLSPVCTVRTYLLAQAPSGYPDSL